jgi:acyl-CoA synthetase (AMP-forming)/AMP-acid ligase II
VRPEQLAGYDLSAWRVAILGAERIDPVAVADFTALTRPFGFRETALIAAYGLAESTLAVSGVVPGAASPLLGMAPGQLTFGDPVQVNGHGVLGVDRAEGNWLTGCGQPVGDLSVRILDEEGMPLPEGRFGEIAVQGSSLADGYLHPDGHVSSFGPEGLRTGDGGFQWDGQVYVVGRIADSIKVRGSAVFAEDLEVELAALPGLNPGRLVVLLGYHDGAAHAVVLVEAASTKGWLDQAVNVVQSSATTHVQVSVLLGRNGAIKRTSSGKPRRRSLWLELLAGTAVNLRTAYGTPPGPQRPEPAPANSEGLSS